MARISDTNTYTRDENLQPGDFLIGTDIGDSNATKSYTLEDLRTYIVNGLGGSIPQLIAKQFAPVTSEDGATIDKSLLRIIDSVELQTVDVLSTGANVEIGVDFDGRAYVQIIDLNDNSFLFNYRLSDIQGKTWTANIAGVSYTGTIAEDGFQIPNFNNERNADPSASRYVDNATHYSFSSTIARTDGEELTLGQSTLVSSFTLNGPINQIRTFVVGEVQFAHDVNFNRNIDVDGNTNLDGTLTVGGVSQFNADVTLGDPTAGNPVDLTVHGTVNIDHPDGVLNLGDVNFNPGEDGNLVIGPDSTTVTIQSDTTFTQAVDVDCPGEADRLPNIGGFTAPVGETTVTFTQADASICVMDNFSTGDTIFVFDSSDPIAMTMGTAGTVTRETIVITFDTALAGTGPFALNSANRIGNQLTTVDCGMITIQGGDGDRLFINDNGIRRVAADGTELPSPTVVVGNPEGAAQGALVSVQIGLDADGNPLIFSIPSPTTDVLSALPGVNETLEGPDGPLTGAQFFYGMEEGNTVRFTGFIPTGVIEPTTPIQIGAVVDPVSNQRITGTITGDAPTSGFVNVFNQVPVDNAQRPAGNGLYFVASDRLPPPNPGDPPPPAFAPTVGEVVTGRVYEVVSYSIDTDVDPDVGTFRFGLLGGGIFTIASSGIRFPSIPQTTDNIQFVRIDPNDQGMLYRSELDIVAAANGARVTGTGQPTDGTPLASIDYVNTLVDEANDSNRHVRITSGDLEVDLSGRGYFGGRHTSALTTTSVAAFQTVVLGTVPMDTVATLDLPEGNTGDWIDIVNHSTYMYNTITRSLALTTPVAPAAPQPIEVESGNWRLLAATGQKIQSMPTGTDLLLDSQKASFRLEYTNADNGWVITGLH